MMSQIMLFGSNLSLLRNKNRLDKCNNSDHKKNDELFCDYMALLEETFSQNGYSHSLLNSNGDPWSPTYHFISKTTKNKLFGYIPYKKDVIIADISSEPHFAYDGLNTVNERYEGLEIKLLNCDDKPIFDEFSKKYEAKFGESPKIVF